MELGGQGVKDQGQEARNAPWLTNAIFKPKTFITLYRLFLKLGGNLAPRSCTNKVKDEGHVEKTHRKCSKPANGQPHHFQT